MEHKKRGKTKVNKPLAERRRRARINDALLQLKSIVLQSISKETTVMSKLEKADILEMTIDYIRNMQTLQGNVTVLVDSQYTNGFNECTSHVADNINDVKDNGVDNNNASSENIRTRLLEHLVNVTASTDFFEISKQRCLGDADKSVEPDMAEGNNSKASSTQMVENVSYSNLEYTRKTEMKEDKIITDKGKVDDSTIPMNYSKTVAIPKKRKDFVDNSNFDGISGKETAKEHGRENMCTSRFGDVKSNILSPTKHSSCRKSRPFLKPIKKRLAALVFNPEDITSGHNTENDSTTKAAKCRNGHRSTGIAGGTEENPVPLRGLHTATNSICEMVNTNQVETNLNNVLPDRLHLVETDMNNPQPLYYSEFYNHEHYMPIQKVDEISQVNVVEHFMDEQYVQKSTLQTQFAYDSDLRAAEIGSGNSYNFYQNYFANNNAENVWRPW